MARGKTDRYDLVIRDGIVVDGSGRAGQHADVAVDSGHIVAVGAIDGSGREEIDAEGHVVTPGFIDGHTHMDAQVFWDGLGTSSCWHGVTTAIMGNCGFSLAPADAAGSDLVIRNLERAEDIPGEAIEAGVDWSWATYAEYLDAVDRVRKGINYGGYVGHSALRTWAMGESAFEGPATDDQMTAMERQLRAGLDAGAMGFTTSRSTEHETTKDEPVASRLASWDEVQRLVAVLRCGGIFQTNSGGVTRSEHGSDSEMTERITKLAVDSGVPVTFTVLSLTPDGRDLREQLELLESVNSAGGRMVGQVSCREVGVLASFKTRLPFDSLPEWAEVRGLPLDEQRRVLMDPMARKRLVRAAYHSNYQRAIGAELRQPDYTCTYALFDALGPNPTVAELAQQRGVDPVEAMIDLALERDFDLFFSQPVANANADVVLLGLRHRHTVPTVTDAGAHVSLIADSSIFTYFFAHWVRTREAFTLEAAVQMVTSRPASIWGLADRGLVREGYVADLNVFDPSAIAPLLPEVVHDLPAGARRLTQRARGIRATVVSGEVLFDDGKHTGAMPGQLLRRGRMVAP